MEAIIDETSSSTRLNARDFFIGRQLTEYHPREKIFSVSIIRAYHVHKIGKDTFYE
jgi:hypothetical protein